MQAAMETAPANTSFLTVPVTPLERDFKAFHEKNGHVYMALESLALRALNAGAKKLGIASMVETLRYNAALQTQGDAYKINNSYRSLYARLLIHNNPELAGVLETRKRVSVANSPYREN